MDLTYLKFENFPIKVLQNKQPVLILCMPQDCDFPGQVQALVSCCEKSGNRLIPVALDENFMEAFKCKYHVKGTPTFLIFQRGKEVDRLLGLHNTEELTRFVRETLGPDPAGIL